MKKCPSCGNECRDNENFCSRCGASLNGVPPVFDMNNTDKFSSQNSYNTKFSNTTNNVGNQQPQKTSTAMKVLYVLLSLFIPIAGLIIYFLLKNEDSQTAKICLGIFIASVILSIVSIVIMVVLSGFFIASNGGMTALLFL